MRYRRIADRTQRSFKAFNGWGIGITIVDHRTNAVASLDIGFENEMVIFKREKLDSIADAKTWAVREVRRIMNELGKWTEE